MQIIDLILLQIITVFIIDLSGFPITLKTYVSKYLTKSKIITSEYSFKPFDCSLCMTHWIGLLYIIITGFSIPLYALVCVLSLTTSNTMNLLLLIKDGINKLIDKWQN